jgi:hypothetical protein
MISARLFRPVGYTGKRSNSTEYHSRFAAKRSPNSHHFILVVTEEYAIQIATDWNAIINDPKVGCVTRFRGKKIFS